jgi:hypothetical protein
MLILWLRLTLERTFEVSPPAFETASTGVEHSLQNADRKASFFVRVIWSLWGRAQFGLSEVLRSLNARYGGGEVER